MHTRGAVAIHTQLRGSDRLLHKNYTKTAEILVNQGVSLTNSKIRGIMKKSRENAK
jgi:hypothetical protein